MEENLDVKVGAAVCVWRDGKFLTYRRHGAHGAGTTSIPGGHLRHGESWEECVSRETLEETGMVIGNIRYLATTNDIMPGDGKHYITIWMEADWVSGEPQILEPGKASELEWHSFRDLPEPLFQPCWDNLHLARPDLFA